MRTAQLSAVARLLRYWQQVVSGGVAICGAPLDRTLEELNVGAGVGAISEATSNAGAAPISLERRTIFGGLVAVKRRWMIAGAA